jgi:FtsP/CotA-like multicopper oxidase with cupredoxin domain
LQDYFHSPIFGVWFAERSTPPIPADTGLINGKNKNMSTGEGDFSLFEFVPGKKYRIRLINVSTDQHFKFSVDEHSMTVQAADFVPVVPYTQRVLDIAVGSTRVILF